MSLRIFGARDTSSAVVFIELLRRDRWSDMLDVSSPFPACIRIAQFFFCVLWSHLLKASHHPSIHNLPILHPLHRSDQRIQSSITSLPSITLRRQTSTSSLFSDQTAPSELVARSQSSQLEPVHTEALPRCRPIPHEMFSESSARYATSKQITRIDYFGPRNGARP